MMQGLIGATVIVEVFQLVSRSSSVPFAERVSDCIGELSMDDEGTYVVIDNGVEAARIFGVYSVEPDVISGNPALFVDGWIAPGKWGRWLVSA